MDPNKVNEIYGRLKESVHITGYSMERACIGLESLLENDNWKMAGGGFKDIKDFLKTIDLSQFKIAVDKRKKLAKKLSDIEASQRSIAKALGVSNVTVHNDLKNVKDLTSENKNTNENERLENESVKNLTPAEINGEIEEFEEQVTLDPLEIAPGEVVKNTEKKIKAEEKKKKKKEERQKQIEEIKQKIKTEEPEKLEGLFDVIVVDPPWNYGRKYDPEGSRVASPYPEMTQNELLNLKLPFKDDSVLFLWTTQAFIWDAKELLDKWGFTYKAMLVWDKEKMGMGKWLRMQCEFCLIGIKGKPVWNNTTYRDIIREPRREHSRKPNCFYEMVNKITVGRKLDYFSREYHKGWDSWGVESEKLEG